VSFSFCCFAQIMELDFFFVLCSLCNYCLVREDKLDLVWRGLIFSFELITRLLMRAKKMKEKDS